jgi:hypothetical protein
MLLVAVFIVWCCYEMHRLDDLSPLAYIGPSVITLGATAVGFYNWRAKQSDMVQIEIKRLELIAQLKQTYGDDLPEFMLSAMSYITNE